MFALKSIQFLRFASAYSCWFTRLFSLLIVLGVLGLLFAGCSSRDKKLLGTPTPTPIMDESLVDRSLLTGEPCAAPCWQTLELGKSTKSDVIAKLQDLTFINASTIDEGSFSYWDPKTEQVVPSIQVHADCRVPKRHCVGLEIVNNQLVAVRLVPNYSLFIKDLVNRFGPPEFIRPVLYQDGKTCVLFYSWEMQQILAESRIPDGKDLCESIENGQGLDKNLSIDGVQYELLGAFIFERQYGQEWPGFLEP